MGLGWQKCHYFNMFYNVIGKKEDLQKKEDQNRQRPRSFMGMIDCVDQKLLSFYLNLITLGDKIQVVWLTPP